MSDLMLSLILGPDKTHTNNQLSDIEVTKYYTSDFSVTTIRDISYRHDYNGRPIVYVINDRMILRIHPSYASSDIHYGRVYQYIQIIDEKINYNALDIYVLDIFSLTDEYLDMCINNFNKNPNAEFIWLGFKFVPRIDITENEIYNLRTNIAGGMIPVNYVGYYKQDGYFYDIFNLIDPIDNLKNIYRLPEEHVRKHTNCEKEYNIKKYDDKDDIYYKNNVLKLTDTHIDIIGVVYSNPGVKTLIYVENNQN